MQKVLLQLAVLIVLSISLFSTAQGQTLYDDLAGMIDYVVAQDGSGDYTTVQAAIDGAPSNSDTTIVIFIRNGSYYEKIIIPNDKPNLTLIGEHVDSTKLWYDDRSVYTVEVNTFTCHSVRVDASDTKIMNLTIENPETASQAVALHGNGDRQTFAHCRVVGFQDTYYTDMRSRNYFKDCFIEGATDYIFGFGVALFDSCQIHSIGSVISAASTPEDYKFGIVFKNSVFATPGSGSFSLGRPWFDYARTVLLDCYEHETLSSRGWDTWDGRENTCYYREYNCFGPGSDISGRVDWAGQLTEAEAAEYTIENIFSADNFANLEDIGNVRDYFNNQQELIDKGLTYDDLLAKSPELDELVGSEDADIVKYFHRWAGHSGEPYLDSIVWRADGEWPVKPTTNWVPDLDNDEVYLTLRKHFKMFLDSANTRSGDFELLANGEVIADFDTADTNYGIELPSGTTTPVTLGIQGDAFATFTDARSVPGFSIATVSAYNRIGGKKYFVYNSVDSAYWDAELTSLTLDRREILIPGVYEYDTIMEPGTTLIPRIRFTKSNSDAESELVRAEEIPGTTYLTITAPDEETVNEFIINYKTIPLSVDDQLKNNELILINPASGKGQIKFTEPPVSGIELSIFSTSGKTLKSFNYSNGEIKNTNLEFDISGLRSGLYILNIQFDNQNISRRLLIK